MFTKWERLERLLLVLAIAVLALDLYYWRP